MSGCGARCAEKENQRRSTIDVDSIIMSSTTNPGSQLRTHNNIQTKTRRRDAQNPIVHKSHEWELETGIRVSLWQANLLLHFN